MDLLDERRLIWFDDPYAPWSPSDPPPVVPASHRAGWRWHRIEETQTWIGVRRPAEHRPAIFTEPYVMVAQVFDQNAAALDEYCCGRARRRRPGPRRRMRCGRTRRSSGGRRRAGQRSCQRHRRSRRESWLDACC
jgi:hypothetical protein